MNYSILIDFLNLKKSSTKLAVDLYGSAKI